MLKVASQSPDFSRTVMIPIVVTDADESTFDYYWQMIALPQDKVLLVHVFSPKDATKEKWHEHKVQLSTVISPFEEQCKQRDMNYQIILHTGKPGEGIIELVKKHKPDLLMIGSRGLSTVRRTIDASVSEYVYHHAKIPVLIVTHKWSDNIMLGDAAESDNVAT